MKRITKQFFERGINSLLISVELFNRPYDIGRVDAVLIALDHAWEMLMKSIIYEQTGRIRGKREKYNYGFKKCVNILTNTLSIIDEYQAMTLNIIDDLRDCAMHHIIALSEESLYFHSQAGVTLFDDLLKKQFGRPLKDYLPERVLPISTSPPSDIETFFDSEFSHIRELVAHHKRNKAEAIAKLRPLIILENNVSGREIPLSDYVVNKIIGNIQTEGNWRRFFPGITSLQMDTAGTGLTYSLRITQKEGIPTRLLKQGEDASDIIAYKEINYLDKYSLTITSVAEKLGIGRSKALAWVEYLQIQKSEELYKEIVISKSRFKRYSPKVLTLLSEQMKVASETEVWEAYHRNHYKKKV